MGLIITTPNVHTEGNATLAKYEFTGNYDRKFFTLKADTGSSVTINLSENGNGFRLFPCILPSVDNFTSINFNLVAGSIISFSVDYDSTWGNETSVLLTATVNIYSEDGSEIVLGPSNPIEFKATSNKTLTKREIAPLLCRDEDNNYQILQAGTKITEDETSFGIIRTNPKLTGNVKITVDSLNDIWLNSIDAVKELADDKYKKYRIGKDSIYTVDVNRFFDTGTTPPEIVYALHQNDDAYTSTQRSLNRQYDRFYQYGVEALKSKFYDEDFSFFAPLYLKTEVPQYFVIFRTEGAINKFSYENTSSEWPSLITSEILSTSKIIKVFDLGETTPIGSYLRNIVNHPSRTETDLTVSYQTNGYTTFNGIAYDKGSFAQMGERLYDYYNVENPLIATEEFITLGLQRNKLISSHVINLEFLFNDETAENYSINRYFGLYVNAIDLVNFDMNADALQKYSLELDQKPVPRRGTDGNKLSQKPFVQTNSNGISIFAEALSIERNTELDDKKYFSSIATVESIPGIGLTATLPGNYSNRISYNDTILFVNAVGATVSGIVSAINILDNDTILSVSASAVSPFFLSGLTHSCNFYTPEKAQHAKESILSNSFIENQPRFFYIKDNQNVLHSVKSTEERIFTNDKFVNEKAIQINLKDTTLDISSLGGFNNILTQTTAKSLESKGKSGISIEVLDFFNNEDYIEISWPVGPTNLGYPLRWKVVANDSYTNPGEIWPDFALTTDIKGEYYLSYFNPGNNTIKLDAFVKSIENAFNIFPYKDFDVVSKSSFLHFRSTQEGRLSDSLRIEFKTFNSSIKVMGVEVGSNTSINFIGGSDRKYTRAKIENSIAAGMLQSEYVSTKGSFSPLRQYSINTNTIIYAPYLDEPILDDSGKLIDFKDCDTYKTICIEDESQPIQLSSDKKLTTYELFRPSFGILSVMPLRDFDMDFHYSDYIKSYTPELREYFSRGEGAKEIATITSVSGNTYTFDKSYDFTNYASSIGATVSIPFLSVSKDGSTSPVLHNSDLQFGFTGPGFTATILSSVSTGFTGVTGGDSIIFMPEDKHLYFKDNELVKFKGFLSLSGIVSVSDEENFKSLENTWDPSRFYLHTINSEYDRLEENYLKTLVLKSRVVPYVNKWVSPQGKDIRDNPYRLNYHRSFGNMSFSPSEEMDIPDPKFHTHEWPYLDSVPDKYPITEFPENAFSYMFDSLSSIYDFSSLDRDWFSEYFTTGYPTEQYFDSAKQKYVPAKLEPTEKYAYFNYQAYNDTTTSFFRGHRFSINELDINGNKVKLSTKYNNYKFSSVIETIEDDSFTFVNPVTFTTIVNEKFKFIVLKITVRTSSYRYTNGNLRYVDLYTLSNGDEIADFNYDNSLTLKSYRDAIPIDRKISVPINFAYPGSLLEYPTINGYEKFTDISSEILTLKSGNYSRLIATRASSTANRIISLSNVLATSKTLVKMENNICYIKGALSTLTIVSTTSINWNSYTIYHQGGGNLSYSGIRDQLSFAEIMKVIKGSSDRKSDMKYLIYDEDGNLTTSPNFSIDTISPEKLTRIYDYYPINDTDKPQEFYTIPQISVNLDQQKDLQTIYRYQGDFAPKFRNVLNFWVREDEIFTDVLSEDFLLNNTHIGTELVDFSLLRNQYFAKVSDNEVLKLSPDSGYQPVYPFINEIAIEKKDDFAWNSTWDNLYYRKYSSTSEYEDLKGTLEMKEIKSYLGSKSMKVPGEFSLYQFKFIKGTKANFSSLADNELSYYEDSKNVYIQVNVYNRLLREMLGTSTDLRAKKEFLKTMDLVPDSFTPDTVDAYVQKYLEDNIVELFNIANINLYVLQTGNSGPDQISTVTLKSSYRPVIEKDLAVTSMNVTLTETELITKNYKLRNDVKITNTGNLKFLITYPLDSRFFTSLSLGVAVKRI